MRRAPSWDEVLIKSITLLLDEEENLSKRDYGKLKETIATIAAATAGGAEKIALSNMFNVLVGTATMGIIPATGIVGNSGDCSWLKKVLPNDSYLSTAGKQKK